MGLLSHHIHVQPNTRSTHDNYTSHERCDSTVYSTLLTRIVRHPKRAPADDFPVLIGCADFQSSSKIMLLYVKRLAMTGFISTVCY